MLQFIPHPLPEKKIEEVSLREVKFVGVIFSYKERRWMEWKLTREEVSYWKTSKLEMFDKTNMWVDVTSFSFLNIWRQIS